MSAPVDKLLGGARDAICQNRHYLADLALAVRCIDEARPAVAELIAKGRQLSADLEHAIAIANVSSPEAVHVRHPIRVALDQFDEALRAAGGAA